MEKPGKKKFNRKVEEERKNPRLMYPSRALVRSNRRFVCG
jgi:hypothetical protein